MSVNGEQQQQQLTYEQEMLAIDMRIHAELEEEENSRSDDGQLKDYPLGCDWIHCIPPNPDGKRDVLQDISFKAIWTLSSCKTGWTPGCYSNIFFSDGYGIHELLHESVDKYWQSDGPQPHTVTIEFPCKTDISFLFLYLDFKNDESYTPSKVVVQTGPSLMHLDDGRDHEFNEPNGWQAIDLRTSKQKPCRAFVIQLQVVQNHQNGRDTHIRHIRVAGPMKPRYDQCDRMLNGDPTKVDDYRAPPITQINDKMVRSMIIR